MSSEILFHLPVRYRRRKGRTSDFRNDVPGREIIYEDLPVNHGGREQTVQEKCSQGVSDSNIAKVIILHEVIVHTSRNHIHSIIIISYPIYLFLVVITMQMIY